MLPILLCAVSRPAALVPTAATVARAPLVPTPAIVARAPPPSLLVPPPPDDVANLALLTRRIDQLKSVHTISAVVLPEVLLPGQRMRLPLMQPELADVLRRSQNATASIGALGTHASDGRMLGFGVEAIVEDLAPEFADSGFGDAQLWSATVVGGRIFECEAGQTFDPAAHAHGDELAIKWIDLGLSDSLSAARSRSRSVELAARELDPIANQWLDLARGGGANLWGTDRTEASPSSGGLARPPADTSRAVDRMLASLGPMPGPASPSERALWVAALINPCGADRDAWPVLDVREAVLTATTPLERLSVAKTGLVDSIYKLKGGHWPMKAYYW